MTDEYICDDRNVLEEVQKIRNMTDEEFEAAMKKLEHELKEKKRTT